MPRLTLWAAIAALAVSHTATAEPQHAGHRHHGQGSAPAMEAGLSAELATVAEAVARFRDWRAASAEGWEPAAIGGEDSALMGEHWTLPDAPEPGPGVPVEITRPQVLQYAEVGGQRVFVGVAYILRLAPGETPPDLFAGPGDVWHLHDMSRIVTTVLEERPLLRWMAEGWLAEAAADGRTEMWMLHAWVGVAAPDGPFAHHNHALPWLRVGLSGDEAAALGALGADAAQGVDLARRDGCDLALEGLLWIADARWSQHRAIRQVCREAAAEVRTALAGDDGEALLEVAAAAWQRVAMAKASVLEPAQLARIDAMMEHR